MYNKGFIGIAAAALFGLVALGAGFFAGHQQQADLQRQINELQSEQNFGSFNPVGGLTYYLYGSGVSSSATSITLTSLTQPVNGYKLTMTDFGTTSYMTLEPGSATRQEFISFTGITQNADGTATLTGVSRGLSPVSPYTASSTIQKAHAGGSVAVLSNPPQFYNQFTKKENDETITGQWTFSTFPITPASPTASETTAGIAEIGTGAETAAGTTNGSVGRLVIPASLGLSTYSAANAPNKVPVTSLSGIIDTRFLGTTTVTLHATTSISGGLTVQGPLTLSGSNATSTIASSSIQAYMSSTTPTLTWTKPANLKYIRVVVQGPGGKGGIGNSLAYAGGGGGGYGEKTIPAAALGSTETVTVGGGATQIASSFGSHISCAAGANGSDNTPGTGGTCTNADFTVTGGTGATGATISSFYHGGKGGDAVLGFGGGPIWNTSATGVSGTVGTGAGGGGSGCASATDGNPSCDGLASNAPNGAPGAIIVYQYFY